MKTTKVSNINLMELYQKLSGHYLRKPKANLIKEHLRYMSHISKYIMKKYLTFLIQHH
jgi:hypothetical protein